MFGSMILQLKPSSEQTDFNLRRWSEILADRELAKLPHRIETDRHGHIIMSPPPAPSHGSRQSGICRLLAELLPRGNSLNECSLSTSDGVKAIDVAWLSAGRSNEAQDSICLTRAPEICVEILSPTNTAGEIQEKIALYLEAGAQEVWVCELDGWMTFYRAAGQMSTSVVCPSFPGMVPAFPVR
jgi:Uma2 family endonuclease